MTWDVLVNLEKLREERQIDRIVLYYNKLQSGMSYEPGSATMFPLDSRWIQTLREKEWKSRTIPTYTQERNELFSFLTRQYIFVFLYRAFIESIASENASRLSSMQVAEKNIDERIEELDARFQHQRQSSITAELLDIVAGFEALTEEKEEEEEEHNLII